MVSDRPLTRQETRFCQLVAQGWPLYRCYVEATGARCKKGSAEVQSYKWRLRPAVESQIIRERAALTDATALTRSEKRNIVAAMARDHATPAAVRVGAIQVDNRMTGDDEPVRVTVTGRVVFTIDPIGDGTRGQGNVGSDAINAHPVRELTDGEHAAGTLPASEQTITLTP